jgi:non-ribosomal peptide synthetase component E (peptide arylation enzyme)
VQSFDRLPVASLSDILRSNARFYPNREAVVCGETRLTWAMLDRNVSRAANGLLFAGIAKGDRSAKSSGGAPG